MVRININSCANGSVDKVSQWYDQNKNFTAKITPTYSGSGCSWTSNVSGISSSGTTITFKADRAVTLTPKVVVPSYTVSIQWIEDWQWANVYVNGVNKGHVSSITVPVGARVAFSTEGRMVHSWVYWHSTWTDVQNEWERIITQSSSERYTYHGDWHFTMPASNVSVRNRGGNNDSNLGWSEIWGCPKPSEYGSGK